MLTNSAGLPKTAASSEEAFRAMLRYFGLLRRVMEPYFARHGISGSQWGVLRVLQRAQCEGHAGVRLMDLGQRLLVRPPSVTGIVRRLTRMGLVETVSSKADHRVRLVSLTPQGRKCVQTIGREHAKHVREIYGILNECETTALNDSLDKLCRHMEELSRETGEKEEA